MEGFLPGGANGRTDAGEPSHGYDLGAEEVVGTHTGHESADRLSDRTYPSAVMSEFLRPEQRNQEIRKNKNADREQN